MQCSFIKYTFDRSLGQPKTSKWSKRKVKQSVSKMEILLKLKANQTKVALHKKCIGWTYWEGTKYGIRKPAYWHDLLLPKFLHAEARQQASPQKPSPKTLVLWASTQKEVHQGSRTRQQGQSRLRECPLLLMSKDSAHEPEKIGPEILDISTSSPNTDVKMLYINYFNEGKMSQSIFLPSLQEGYWTGWILFFQYLELQ